MFSVHFPFSLPRISRAGDFMHSHLCQEQGEHLTTQTALLLLKIKRSGGIVFIWKNWSYIDMYPLDIPANMIY
jgi:hypothetical protein